MPRKSKKVVEEVVDTPKEDEPKVERFFDDEKKLHRDDDLPAVIVEDGPQYWLQHGVQHRENGPAVVYPDGSFEYWFEGKKHREDGPAVETANGKFWMLEGEYHRIDGPAQELTDGTIEWWIDGGNITDLVEEWMTKMRITYPFSDRAKWLFERDFG